MPSKKDVEKTKPLSDHPKNQAPTAEEAEHTQLPASKAPSHSQATSVIPVESSPATATPWYKNVDRLLAVGAILISMVSVLFTAMQAQQAREQTQVAREQVELSKHEASIQPVLDAALMRQLPVQVVSDGSRTPALLLYPNLSDHDMLSSVEVWYLLTATNAGNKTFSISDIDYRLITQTDDGKPNEVYLSGMNRGVYASPEEPMKFPILVEPGHQVRVLLKVRVPALESNVKALQEDFPGQSPAYQIALRRSLAKRGTTLSNQKVTVTEYGGDTYSIVYDNREPVELKVIARIASGEEVSITAAMP